MPIARNKAPDPLATALSQLRSFLWPSGPLRTVDEAPAWNEQGLIDNKYGRELTEAESAYEKRHYECFNAVQTRMTEFRTLTGLCSKFVSEVIHSGRQDALGRRANLDPQPIMRPSRTIHFDRVSLPDATETVSQYTKRIGGAHVLWARLLWWSAAAESPDDFGYERTFFIELAGQPFWINRREDGLFQFNPAVLGHLREAASLIAAIDPAPNKGALPMGTNRVSGINSQTLSMAAHKTNQGDAPRIPQVTPSLEESDETDDVPEPNGCGKGLRFWWNGKFAKLDPKEYLLMEYLDPAMVKGAAVGEIRDILWSARGYGTSTYSATLTGIRTKFDEAELGINVKAEIRGLGTEKKLFIIPLKPGERAKRPSICTKKQAKKQAKKRKPKS